MKKIFLFLVSFLLPLSIGIALSNNFILKVRGEKQSSECEKLGWFPENFDLKDHSVFTFDGYYYIVSIYLPGEQFFAYARSQNLCNWEDLSPILTARTSGWDEQAVWAPQVFEESGVYYMYYTGVKGPYPSLTQSIMLATTTNPSDPSSWQIEGLVFQPNHDGMIWEDNTWADCRDAHVIKQGNIYYMLYTGLDVDGGIIGMATAPHPKGPWQDFGSIMTLDGQGMAESPTLWQANGGFYLIYNRASSIWPRGEMFRFGPTPSGPWNSETLIPVGWAHEVWSDIDGKVFMSYLTSYDVNINPLIWDDRFIPAKPFIGEQIIEGFLPVTSR